VYVPPVLNHQHHLGLHCFLDQMSHLQRAAGKSAQAAKQMLRTSIPQANAFAAANLQLELYVPLTNMQLELHVPFTNKGQHSIMTA